MKVRNVEDENRKKTRVPPPPPPQQQSLAVHRGERGQRKKQQQIPMRRLQSSPAPRREQRERGLEVEEERDGGKGKTVVVGFRMDAQSRELLTWAFVKVASPGDCVIAVHVLPPATKESPDVDINSSTSLLSLVKALAVYEGFCNLKQIELKMKICRGSSVRKILVEEARPYGAVSLILGVNKNVRTIGSVAKYCGKKLPPECAVLAVNNGKVVYQREASPAPPWTGTVSEKAAPAALGNVRTCQATKKSSISSSLLRRSTSEIKCRPGRAVAADGVAEGRDRSASCSAATEDKAPPKSEEPRTNQSLAIVPAKKSEAPLRSLSAMFMDRSETRTGSGWSLLRRAGISDKGTAHLEKRPRLSVVQWAMRLPSRYTAVRASQGGHKTIKSGAKVSSEHKPDVETLVPIVGADYFSSSPSSVGKGGQKDPEELKFLEGKYASVCKLFSYEELVHITGNFSPDNLVGKGGSSRVFRGHLKVGKELAVKVLKPSEDVKKEFVSEIEIITALRHKNIVSLSGFCFENKNLILVYDFLSRGNLEDNLQGKRCNKIPLGWAERYKVALGVAEALNYLHGADNPQPVIHRDVKSSNILLSEAFEPKLSDFGLALWASSPASQLICIDVAGTFGYLAPEYFMYGKVTDKTDVYALGVVLLELVSGRKPVSTGCPKGEESLVMWAMSILQGGKVEQLVDPCLGRDYDEGQLYRMISAASICIQRAPRSRSTMPHVLKVLRGDVEMLKWNASQVGSQEEVDELDEEATLRQPKNIQSHIKLALLDIDNDSVSVSSMEPADFPHCKQDHGGVRARQMESFLQL